MPQRAARQTIQDGRPKPLRRLASKFLVGLHALRSPRELFMILLTSVAIWLTEKHDETRAYLPRDARFEATEPFVFRNRESGTRERHHSAALAAVFSTETYAAVSAPGPAGACVITYYRTSAGGVAFLLVGLA